MGHGSTNTVGLMLLTMVDTAELLTPNLAKLLIFSISVFFWEKLFAVFNSDFPDEGPSSTDRVRIFPLDK